VTRWTDLRFLMCGGEKREAEAASRLARWGVRVDTLGGDATETARAVESADVLVGPVSGVGRGGTIRCRASNNLQVPADLVHRGQLVLVGAADPAWAQNVRERGATLVEYRERDDFALANAVPTAEGAIQMAMELTDITLHGATVAVLGAGRTAMPLALKLKGLSARVFVLARRSEALAAAAAYGLEAIPLDRAPEGLDRCDVVFNTIPAMILDALLIEALSPHCVIIDLASAPGGTDFAAAAAAGRRAVLAPGLPGKVAPRTAGWILADVIRGAILEMPGYQP
jgi:dipicolinate synthase subunit A